MDIYEKFEELRLMPYGPVPNERQMEWYSREKSVFFHFGMNTFTGKEWGDGTEDPSLFNPTELDVRQWIRTIKEAGFTTAILTAKHHDGFCLFQTKETEHSIKNSPYKNGQGDVLDEFIKACREYDIKAGIYLSPWDRHEKTWGSFDYNHFYTGQLIEIYLRYNDIWEVWWDGAGSTEADYRWDWWAYNVRTSFPNAVIFGSLGATPYVDVRWVGNEKGIAGKPCYATIDESSLINEITSELNSGKVDGECFIPAEVDVSIRPGWFYHKEQDTQVRSPENLMRLWFSSVGSNAGLLLNIPPDKRGLIHENDVKALLGFKKLYDESFKENLALGSNVTASSVREGCTAEDILGDVLYAPTDKDRTPEIIFDLGTEKEINTFVISERIELGHKIKDTEFYAYINDEWKLVSKNKCVGYKLAEYFGTVKASKFKIKVIDAYDTPILYGFGLYKIDERIFEEEKTAKKRLDVSKNVENNEITLSFGGIVPFNQINIDTEEKSQLELHIFNGTSYVKQGEYTVEGKLEIKLPLIDYSYQIKIIFNSGNAEKSTVEVLNS